MASPVSSTLHTAAPVPLLGLLNPAAMLRNLWRHRDLMWQLARRDVAGRYKAAGLGFLWAILTPLCLLTIYTFVFTVVFKARWRADASEGKGLFALTMFSGLLLYNLFLEVVNRAPGLIVGNPNYVKKVVFPLEIFVVSSLLSAAFTMLVGYGVWLLGFLIVLDAWPPGTICLFPLVVLPVAVLSTGLGWILASLGVFIRDVGHAVLLVTQILFFATPIFYSIEQVPEPWRHILKLNPLAQSVEDVRRVLMWGEMPHWGTWFVTLLASSVVAVVGYAFFNKSKRAFADVL